jgi:uncharacterized protein YcaQ
LNEKVTVTPVKRQSLFCDRRIALDLFNFDYKIEVYMFTPKRKYGYFTLPILWDNALIGRIDPKAHPPQGGYF